MSGEGKPTMTPSRFAMSLYRCDGGWWNWRIEAFSGESKSKRWTMVSTWGYQKIPSAKAAAMRYARELGIKCEGVSIEWEIPEREQP